jgi:hypothetical protein
LVVALAVGVLALGLGLVVASMLDRPNAASAPGQRRFLRAMGLAGLGLVVGGPAAVQPVAGCHVPIPGPLLWMICTTGLDRASSA